MESDEDRRGRVRREDGDGQVDAYLVHRQVQCERRFRDDGEPRDDLRHGQGAHGERLHAHGLHFQGLGDLQRRDDRGLYGQAVRQQPHVHRQRYGQPLRRVAGEHLHREVQRERRQRHDGAARLYLRTGRVAYGECVHARGIRLRRMDDVREWDDGRLHGRTVSAEPLHPGERDGEPLREVDGQVVRGRFGRRREPGRQRVAAVQDDPARDRQVGARHDGYRGRRHVRADQLEQQGDHYPVG